MRVRKNPRAHFFRRRAVNHLILPRHRLRSLLVSQPMFFNVRIDLEPRPRYRQFYTISFSILGHGRPDSPRPRQWIHAYSVGHLAHPGGCVPVFPMCFALFLYYFGDNSLVCVRCLYYSGDYCPYKFVIKVCTEFVFITDINIMSVHHVVVCFESNQLRYSLAG